MRANENLHGSVEPIRNRPAGVADRALRPTRALRVLVVDDDPDAGDGMALLLETLGHVAVTARDGVEALAALLEGQPDIALVDIRLPGMDGYELAARIRALDPDQAIRLVALTGFADPEDRARALAAGFHVHLAKPVELERLEELLAGSRR
jgi:CheY-like chemotaxis protein